jgi:multiple sugar transport system substrate-binding protein
MISLRGLTWKNPRGYDPLVVGARQWMERQPGVSIQWDQAPWYEFEEKVFQSLNHGGEAYDIFMFDHPWTGTLAENARLLPWNDLLSGDELRSLRQRVVEPSWESYIWQDRLWALPLDAACHAALVRSDLLDPSELPASWEGMVEWVRSHHHPPHRYGLVLNLEGVLGHCLFLSMMAGLGHAAYHDADSPTCDREAAGRVLVLLKTLQAFCPPTSHRWGPWDLYEHFITQDDIAYCPSVFAYVNYFQGGERNRALRLASVPGFEGRQPASILGGVGLGVARNCPYPQEAAAYGAFLMSDPVQQEIFPQHHGQPAARAAWHDPSINSHFGNFYRDLQTQMRHAYIRPRYAGFHERELHNGRILQAFWEDRSSLQETLDQLNAV